MDEFDQTFNGVISGHLTILSSNKRHVQTAFYASKMTFFPILSAFSTYSYCTNHHLNDPTELLFFSLGKLTFSSNLNGTFYGINHCLIHITNIVRIPPFFIFSQCEYFVECLLFMLRRVTNW